jgi:hypothetical protein
MSFTRADYPPLSTIGYVSTITSVSFNPASITGCQLWLDGSDPAGTGVVPSNGTVLTSWIDKSGNLKHAAGVNSPTVVTSAVNSLSAVSYNGSSYSYSSIASGTFSSGMIIFIVYKVNGSVTYCAPITRSIGNMGYPIDQYNGVRYLYGSGGGSSWSHASATSTTLFTQIILSSGGTTLSEYVNGTGATITGSFPYNDGASYVYIGTRDDKVTSFNGYMCEALAYNNASMTVSQRQQVEGYLAWKWGIQANLIAGHPYASVSPVTTTSTIASTITLNLAGYVQSGANYILKATIPLSITPYYTGFNPATLSTLALWIDGADPLGTGVAPAQGTLLSSLKDKSGNNRAISTFSTTVGFPTYKTSANGSLGAIQLAAGNGIFLSSISLTPYMSLYAVYSPILPSTGISIEQGVNALANAGFLLTSVSTTSTVFTFGVAGATITATGGTVITSGAFKIHTFTTTGANTFTLTSPASITAQVLVVAGGGGGGSAYAAGGGGAGGAVYNATFTITAGTYTVTVGSGGTRTSGGVGILGNQGNNSVFSTLTGYGGGAGASYNLSMTAGSGGCGGGSSWGGTAGTGSQGYGGGLSASKQDSLGFNCGGGGGGMGSAGVSPSTTRPNGGSGATYTVAGASYLVSGGGGAGSDGLGGLGLDGGGLGGNGNNGGNTASNGGDATGYGGGGGGGGGNNASLYGGAGYQGIVIIAYLA